MTYSSPPSRRYLFSPSIDFLFAGGMSVILLPLLFFMFPVTSEGKVANNLIFNVSIVFAVLAYVVNHPHFMVSYDIMYRGFSAKLRAHASQRAMYLRYVTAGIIVPAILLIYLTYAFIAQDQAVFAIGVQILFFTVGWHYVKQAFGIFIMLSALKHIYYGHTIRRLLLVNCWLVWMLSWLGGNIWVQGYENSINDFWGVRYTPLGIGIPQYMIQWLSYCVIAYGALVACALLLHAWKIRTRPSITALSGYTSMYTLLLFSYYHPLWIYMTPFLHSAQYLLFAAAYKRGESQSLMQEQHVPRASITHNTKQFILISFFLGILLFTGIPKTLTWLTGGVADMHGLFLPFLYAFSIFINIHHYFIDNVIWRKENIHVGKYLFYHSNFVQS